MGIEYNGPMMKADMEEVTQEDEVFSVEQFVEHLLTEGRNCHYDERPEYVGENNDLPIFYNEEMFKKCQKLFYKNTLGIFLGCFLALLLGFAQPFAKVLLMTNKSSTSEKAYRRYAATIMHMCTWYESDFQPGSKLWSSIAKVRSMHTAAFKQSESRLRHRISQYDMNMALIGFMGFPVMKHEMMGIKASQDELKCFIHFWRVMGHLFGIRDEFNVCRNSVKETQQICLLLIHKDIVPHMKKKPEYFEILSRAFVSGMQAIIPTMYYDHSLEYLNMVINSITNNETLKLPKGTSRCNYLRILMKIMKYNLGMIIFNHIFRMMLWLLKNCPIFAYYRFGFKKSHVKI